MAFTTCKIANFFNIPQYEQLRNGCGCLMYFILNQFLTFEAGLGLISLVLHPLINYKIDAFLIEWNPILKKAQWVLCQSLP